jgi:hypothetical protein
MVGRNDARQLAGSFFASPGYTRLLDKMEFGQQVEWETGLWKEHFPNHPAYVEVLTLLLEIVSR